MSTAATHTKPGQFTAMISSTALDLEKHRPAVEAACIAAGIFPIWMKHLPARDASGVKVSFEMVEKADLYIGIYAWRYGWVPNGGNKSITELEFDHAVKRKADGKLHELLIFTAHEDHPCTKKDIEADAAAQVKLAAFKTRACDGRGKKDFSSVEELQRVVSEALHEFLHREEAKKAAEHTTAPPHPSIAALKVSIPNNLPPLFSFFGREKELKTIADALAPEARTWGALIDGPGGMGKTSLAIRAAELVPANRFKQIIFLSAKERELTADGQRPLKGFVLPSYLQMLNELANQLGQPELAKLAEEERTLRLHQKLQNADALLIFDNLESLSSEHRDQVFAFVGRLPHGCKAIVTSRRRTDVDARIIRLGKLDQDAALKYIEELSTDRDLLAKATPDERLHLYQETGGNPLLLRWVVGQLGRGNCRNITNAIALCRRANAANTPLEFIFGDLLETFSKAETKVLAALTFFTQTVAVKFISELAELSQVVAHTALEDLANRALVMPDETDDTFILVPMVADFMRNKRPEVVQDTAHWLESRAFAIIIENGYQEHSRFPKLEAAWPGIAPALPIFFTGDNARLQTVCNSLNTFLSFQGRWDEWLALCEKAEVRAVVAADHVHAGWRAYWAGYIHYLRRQADLVLTCASRAAAHWGRAKAGSHELGLAIQLCGIGHQLSENYSSAIIAYGEALELHRSWEAESAQVAISLNYLAGAELRSGNFDAAEGHHREALRIARTVGDAETVANSIGELAGLALARVDWPTAEILAREALSLAEAVHRQELIARNNQRLAQAIVRQGKGAEGLGYARRAVAIFTQLGSPDLESARATLRECEPQ